MQSMVEREAAGVLYGTVQIDDAYLGGVFNRGTLGRGSENKIPFIGAVSLDADGYPLRSKFNPLPGFTRQAIAAWASAQLSPQSAVISDCLACFAGVTDIGYTHQPIVVGGRKSKELPMFQWIKTLQGNLKTSLNGAYHSFGFGKYAERYLGAIAYRFYRRFNLHALPNRPPRPLTPRHAGCAWLKHLANQDAGYPICFGLEFLR